MGKDKAFIELGGRTLLARALGLAKGISSDVRIVGEAGKFSGLGAVVVEDLYPGQGPLGGIHAALQCSQAELNLLLAVDMPQVPVKFLDFLISAARQTEAVAILPKTSAGWQPLCAVYRRELAVLAEESLRRNENKIDPLFSLIKTRILGEEELAKEGFPPEIFRNLNTPEDFAAAERELAG